MLQTNLCFPGVIPGGKRSRNLQQSGGFLLPGASATASRNWRATSITRGWSSGYRNSLTRNSMPCLKSRLQTGTACSPGQHTGPAEPWGGPQKRLLSGRQRRDYPQRQIGARGRHRYKNLSRSYRLCSRRNSYQCSQDASTAQIGRLLGCGPRSQRWTKISTRRT